MNLSETALTTRIEEEHRLLKQCMGDLLAELEKEAPEDSFRVWKLHFLWRLRDFQNQLLKHFDLEEERELIDDVLRVAPQYAGRIERQKDDHRRILADLEHTIDMLKGVEQASSSRLILVTGRIRNLMASFDAHEREEVRLVQDVYYQDYGVGD